MTVTSLLRISLLLLILTNELLADHCHGHYCVKTSEYSDIVIDGHFCGDQIYMAYGYVCGYFKKRRKRDTREKQPLLESKNKGNAFLKSRRKRSYNIVEECCYEGCSFEEISEYC
ncbi:insulin-like [Actinia tenebrosa]|uniref:Insulin-like n=1 Tax=Actinia tenebrosa TaxID=6105 RepID=A0A6P8HRZ6_ACTTE|nr:insulin-like [Actinia tenebrosa]